MKNISYRLSFVLWCIVILFLLIDFTGISATTLFAYSSGPPDGRTGSPADSLKTCNDTGCHNSYALNSGSAIFSLSAPSSYTLGETLSISISFGNSSTLKHGFELSALDANNNHVGTFISVDSNTQTSNGNYIKHTSAGSSQSGNASWNVQWTVPTSEVQNPVTFYAAGNEANGNLTNQGDYIYTTTKISNVVSTPTTTPSTTPVTTPTPTPTPSTLPTPTGGNSIIFGFVHDEEDNVLRGVSVAIKGDTYSNRTENDADGFYEFRNLLAGDYTLTYEKDGFQTYTESISLLDGEIKEIRTITLETVVPTPTPSPTPLPSNIFGFVYDSEKEPIQDVTVTIKGNNYSGSTSTDEYGYYELKNLSSGDYTLTYSKEGYQTQTQDVTLGENEEQDLGILTLESVEKGSIFGYVVDFRGYEIGSATIRMKGLHTGYSKTISSDIDGYFEFTDLDADTYILTAKKSGYRQGKRVVKLREGESTEVKLKMKRKRTTSVQSQF